jgi:hypothetical protein
MIHARDEAAFERAAAILQNAYVLGKARRRSPAVLQRIGPTVR